MRIARRQHDVQVGPSVLAVIEIQQVDGLTPAESTVLELLSDGLQPSDIARANAVGMTTVRTQIKGIRDKTCTASIRGLLHQVALLPPMVCSLRC